MSLCLAIKTNEREEKGILEVKADVERDKVRLTLQVPRGRYFFKPNNFPKSNYGLS